MLQKVFYSNIFNWEYTTERDYSFDFLIYMFTYFFQKAIRQAEFLKAIKIENITMQMLEALLI